ARRPPDSHTAHGIPPPRAPRSPHCRRRNRPDRDRRSRRRYAIDRHAYNRDVSNRLLTWTQNLNLAEARELGGVVAANLANVVRNHRGHDDDIEDVLARDRVLANEREDRGADAVAGKEFADSWIVQVLLQLSGGVRSAERLADAPGIGDHGIKLE